MGGTIFENRTEVFGIVGLEGHIVTTGKAKHDELVANDPYLIEEGYKIAEPSEHLLTYTCVDLCNAGLQGSLSTLPDGACKFFRAGIVIVISL